MGSDVYHFLKPWIFSQPSINGEEENWVLQFCRSHFFKSLQTTDISSNLLKCNLWEKRLKRIVLQILQQ